MNEPLPVRHTGAVVSAFPGVGRLTTAGDLDDVVSLVADVVEARGK